MLSSSSGHPMDNDVARLYMNESLRYQEDVNLHEFSLFAGTEDLVSSNRHHHQRHHHNYHHHHQQQQQQQQQYDERPSRIPRPAAFSSRRYSLNTTFATTYKPSAPLPTSSASSALPSSFMHLYVTSPAVPAQPLPSQATTTQNTPAVTKNSTTKSTSSDTTVAEPVPEIQSRSHQRSASTWETHRTLADLWTEFQ